MPPRSLYAQYVVTRALSSLRRATQGIYVADTWAAYKAANLTSAYRKGRGYLPNHNARGLGARLGSPAAGAAGQLLPARAVGDRVLPARLQEGDKSVELVRRHEPTILRHVESAIRDADGDLVGRELIADVGQIGAADAAVPANHVAVGAAVRAPQLGALER